MPINRNPNPFLRVADADPSPLEGATCPGCGGELRIEVEKQFGYTVERCSCCPHMQRIVETIAPTDPERPNDDLGTQAMRRARGVLTDAVIAALPTSRKEARSAKDLATATGFSSSEIAGVVSGLLRRGHVQAYNARNADRSSKRSHVKRYWRAA